MKPSITDSNKESRNEHEKVKILNATKVEDIIRRAYLSRAKECHPYKKGHGHDFQAVKKAYEHLKSGGLVTKQQNLMHSIHLMLEVQKKNTAMDNEKVIDLNDEMKLFKPRLIAVLLEYGDKGIHLSNIPKVTI